MPGCGVSNEINNTNPRIQTPGETQLSEQTGFTLIEIMVVVIIIGILSAMVAPVVVGRLENARIEAAMVELRTIEGALKMYRVDNFGYPTTELGLLALVEKPLGSDGLNWNDDGYLDDDKVPIDPWGMEFQYLSPGPDGSDYYAYSFGADRQPGGDGAKADISTSDL